MTLFRALTGGLPYANPDATLPPRQEHPRDLAALRPDLSAWLAASLARAIAADPAERYADGAAFAAELEAGPAYAPPLAASLWWR